MARLDPIDEFLEGGPHAVVGASRDRDKFGNKVLRAYLAANRRAYPVNPMADEVEGLRAVADLASLPERVHGISVVTPPGVTEHIIEDAIAAGIRHVWLQPGAESAAALRRAQAAGISLVWGGPCILVELRRRGRDLGRD